MMQEQIDKSILEKQNLHCQTLLKIVKTVKLEKQKLEEGFKEIEIKSCEKDQRIQELEEINKLFVIKNQEQSSEIEQLQQKNTNLDLQSKEKDQLIEQLKRKNAELYQSNLDKDHQIEKLKYENTELREQLQYLSKETQQQNNMQSSITSSTFCKDINQSIIAQDQYNKTRIQVTKEQVKFIEEFYIITIPDTDLRETSPQPKVVFKHPIEAESIVPGLLTQLPLFIFPHALKSVPITTKSELQNILNMQIKTENINITVFTPCKATGMRIQNQFIIESNPDQLLYAISIMDTDFLVEEGHKKKQEASQSKKYSENVQNIHKTTVAYVILTYFPFIEFFNKTLLNLVNQLKTTRLDSLKSDLPRDWKYMDAYFFSFYENDIRMYFDQLMAIPINFKFPLCVPFFGQFQYRIDQLTPFLYTFEGAPQNLLQGWDGGIIVAIFAGLLLECKIIIQGYSREQIAYLMLLFLFAIKPFHYCHPLLLEVPDSQYPLMDAPVPVFLGTSDYHITSDECVIVRAWGRTPRIENGLVLSELVKKIDQFFQDFNKQNYKFLYKIEGIVSLCSTFLKLEILKNKNQNDNFVQLFYQTQLYHNYVSQ